MNLHNGGGEGEVNYARLFNKNIKIVCFGFQTSVVFKLTKSGGISST